MLDSQSGFHARTRFAGEDRARDSDLLVRRRLLVPFPQRGSRRFYRQTGPGLQAG